MSQSKKITLSSAEIESYRYTDGKDYYYSGYLDLEDSPIVRLPNNLKVNGSIDLEDSGIEKLPENLEVASNIYIRDTKIDKIPKSLRCTGGILVFRGYYIRMVDGVYSIMNDNEIVPLEHLKEDLAGSPDEPRILKLLDSVFSKSIDISKGIQWIPIQN